MTKPDDLTTYIFDGRGHPLSRELLRWMEESPRFADFVETYRDKIRKKVRVTHEPEGVLDVRGELEVAYRLLGDRRLEVSYEPYASAKRRGPDFAVTYRANLVFNVEVARLHRETGENGAVRHEERMLRVMMNKLGQMQPGMANLLVIQPPVEVARSVDLGRMMQAVKTRVERRDDSFYAASRYASPAEFYKDFLRLSGIVLWGAGAQVWVNRQARPPLEENVARLVGELGRGDGGRTTMGEG